MSGSLDEETTSTYLFELTDGLVVKVELPVPLRQFDSEMALHNMAGLFAEGGKPIRLDLSTESFCILLPYLKSGVVPRRSKIADWVKFVTACDYLGASILPELATDDAEYVYRSALTYSALVDREVEKRIRELHAARVDGCDDPPADMELYAKLNERKLGPHDSIGLCSIIEQTRIGQLIQELSPMFNVPLDSHAFVQQYPYVIHHSIHAEQIEYIGVVAEVVASINSAVPGFPWQGTTRLVLAGGAVLKHMATATGARKFYHSDYDFFLIGGDEETAREAIIRVDRWVASRTGGYYIMVRTKHAISFLTEGGVYQVVLRLYGATTKSALMAAAVGATADAAKPRAAATVDATADVAVVATADVAVVATADVAVVATADVAVVATAAATESHAAATESHADATQSHAAATESHAAATQSLAAATDEKSPVADRPYLLGVEQLLCGFDIDPCAVAFDGARVWSIPRAERALRSNVIMVDPERQSTTALKRYRKYCYDRGFLLALPGLPEKTYARLRVKRKLAVTNFISNDGAHSMVTRLISGGRIRDQSGDYAPEYEPLQLRAVRWATRDQRFTHHVRAYAEQIRHGTKSTTIVMSRRIEAILDTPAGETSAGLRATITVGNPDSVYTAPNAPASSVQIIRRLGHGQLSGSFDPVVSRDWFPDYHGY